MKVVRDVICAARVVEVFSLNGSQTISVPIRLFELLCSSFLFIWVEHGNAIHSFIPRNVILEKNKSQLCCVIYQHPFSLLKHDAFNPSFCINFLFKRFFFCYCSCKHPASKHLTETRFYKMLIQNLFVFIVLNSFQF